MPEYLYRNDNNDERQWGGKKTWRLVYKISAKLRRLSCVSIDDSHWLSYTTRLQWIYSKGSQKQLSTSTIRSWVRIHERNWKIVTTRVVNLAKYGHDFTACFITRILIRCYCIFFLNEISTGRRMNQLSNDTYLSRVMEKKLYYNIIPNRAEFQSCARNLVNSVLDFANPVFTPISDLKNSVVSHKKSTSSNIFCVNDFFHVLRAAENHSSTVAWPSYEW